MGVWEDAQRNAAQQTDDEMRWHRENSVHARNANDIAEFINGMRRLNIAPLEHRFLKKLYGPGNYKPTRHRLAGWSVHAPRSSAATWLVVTPSGDLFDMQDQDRKPINLRDYVGFGPDGDYKLADVLVSGLTAAIRGD